MCLSSPSTHLFHHIPFLSLQHYPLNCPEWFFTLPSRLKTSDPFRSRPETGELTKNKAQKEIIKLTCTRMCMYVCVYVCMCVTCVLITCLSILWFKVTVFSLNTNIVIGVLLILSWEKNTLIMIHFQFLISIFFRWSSILYTPANQTESRYLGFCDFPPTFRLTCSQHFQYEHF